MTTTDALVTGGSVSGQLTAAYLRKRFPRLTLAVVEGRPSRSRPVVGESFVEITERFRHGVTSGGAWTVEAAEREPEKLRGSRYRLALVEVKWNSLPQTTAATRALEPPPMNKR